MPSAPPGSSVTAPLLLPPPGVPGGAPESTRPLDAAERRSMSAAAGVMALGPVMMVSGCLRATDGENEKANEFALSGMTAPISLTQMPPPSGTSTLRVVGLIPDLRRHTGEAVEIVGTVVEEMPSESSATLEMKSIRKLAEGCRPSASIPSLQTSRLR